MNLSTDEARDRFTRARVARLATVGEHSQPHLVPVVFAVAGETIVLAIDHKPKARKEARRLANIRTNPSVSLLVDHYDEDWTRLWWVRADGEATITDVSVDPLVAKYEQYQEIRPAGPTILVSVTKWTGWAWHSTSG